jgi:threonine dehydrogenase-like Zn-dependent dehydrogenase
MNALQLVKPRTYRPVQVPVPDLSSAVPGSILVHTRWVSLCGSDIPFFTGAKRGMTFPYPTGAPVHEAVGQVISSTSTRIQAGDMVLAIPDGNQGLAELFTAHESRAMVLAPGLEPFDTCCLIQPLSTVLNAVDRLGDLTGKAVMVVGLGSIGLMFCFLLKLRGAARVTGIDPIEERCRFAMQLGADCTHALTSSEAVHLARLDPVSWLLPDIVIEAVGHQTQTINDCLHLLRQEGNLLAFGVPDEPVYPLEDEIFFRKKARLVAVVTPKWSEYFPKARDVFLAHRSTLETLFTHRMEIQYAGQAFTAYEQHAAGLIKLLLDGSCWTEKAEKSKGETND